MNEVIDGLSTKSHILIIVENLPVPFDRRVWMEATTLARAGYKVSVICPQRANFAAPYEVLDDVEIYRHPMPLELSTKAAFLREYACALWFEILIAVKIWRKSRFQAIHICNPPDLLFLVALPFKLFFGVKLIFDQHDPTPEVYFDKFNRKDFFYRVLRLCERTTVALADRIIAVNESTKKRVLNLYRIKPERVTVIRSGPDLKIFKRQAANPALKHNREFAIGFLGIIAKEDGVEMLAHLAKILVIERARTNIQFLVIGDGVNRPQVTQLAETLGVSNNFTFFGLKYGNELTEILSTFDIAIAPDPLTPLTNIATTNKILEYMSMGIPIVCFDLSEARNSAGDAAFYCRPGDIRQMADIVEQLLQDAKLRENMGRLGYERMENELQWSHQAKHLVAFYQEVLPFE